MTTDPFDELLRALSSPARPDELVGEAEAVESIAASLSSEEPRMIPSSRRRLRVAAIVSCGVIGFAGVAAAGPGGFDFSAPPSFVDDLPATTDASTSTTTSTTTTVAVDTTLVNEVPPPPSVDDTVLDTTPDTTDDTVPDDTVDTTVPSTVTGDTIACDEAENHGEYVSSVAQATEPGPGKGQIVSEAAHSDCGKHGADDTDTTEPTDTTTEAAETGEHEDDGTPGERGRPDSPGRSDEAPGQNNDNGHGSQGNGNQGNGRGGRGG